MSVEQPTRAEEERLREHLAAFAVVGGAQSDRRLHIPSGETTACARDKNGGRVSKWDSDDIELKATATYPPGYAPICQYCLRHWRAHQETHADE